MYLMAGPLGKAAGNLPNMKCMVHDSMCALPQFTHVFTMSLFFCHSEFLIPLRIFAPIAQRHNYSTNTVFTAALQH